MTSSPSRKIVLRKSQRAGLAKVLAREELSPQEFKWTNVASSTIKDLSVPRLSHIVSGYSFTFDRMDKDGLEEWFVKFSPDEEELEKAYATTLWSTVLDVFHEWITYLRLELEAEDPWAELEEEFAGTWTNSNDTFSNTELTKLDSRLDEVEQYLISQSDNSVSTLEEIRLGIDGLKKSARTLGKKDWATMFIGWFFMHCADWMISQAHWQHIVTILLKSTKTFLLQ